MKHIISLGAGVQSSTMALMAAHGEIGPMPIAAVFADTQAEPESVYKWLAWLETQLPFPVVRGRAKKSLPEVATTVRTAVTTGQQYAKGVIPAYLLRADGKKGIMARQCTGDFKITVVRRELQKLREGHIVVQWMGISIDEAHRMKSSQRAYIKNRYPLIDLGISREDCLAWMQSQGYPEPPRSSCVFCPYHSNSEWRRLRDTEPAEFARAIQFEKDYQETYRIVGLRGVPYLHASRRPLGEVDLGAPSSEKQFGNECEGVCGV